MASHCGQSLHLPLLYFIKAGSSDGLPSVNSVFMCRHVHKFGTHASNNYAGMWPNIFPSKAENHILVMFIVEFNANKLPFT